jgi:hypothetical protein
MTSEAKTTTDHDEIRRWIEERGGKPATVSRTAEGDEPGILRVDFPGFAFRHLTLTTQKLGL